MTGFDLPDEGDLGQLLGGEGADAQLDRWLADARVEAAARQRSSERWLRRQAEEEATLAGVLVDLAERGVEVAVHTTGDRVHRGRVSRVGEDFVQITVARAADVLIRIGVVAAVRTGPGVPPTTGDRAVTGRVPLAEAIVGCVEERQRVVVVPVAGGPPLCGVVQSVGQDVVVLRLDGDTAAGGGCAYVPLEAVGELIPDV